MRKNLKIITFLLVICLVLAGCSGGGSNSRSEIQSDSGYQSSGSDSNYNSYGIAKQKSADSAMVDEEQAEMDQMNDNNDGQVSEEQNQEADNPEQKDIKAEKKEEKLVYTCDIDIETTTYQDTMDEIEKVIQKHSGIIDSQSEYDNASGWYMSDYEKTGGTLGTNMVVRIPSKNYKAFLKDLDGKGKMTRKTMNVTNISRSYYDVEATIESLKLQESRLLEMMKQAKTIDEMISVENRLTEVQTQLNQYKTQLSIMDTDVAYSTITLNISEVLEYKEHQPGRKTNTFVQRLINTIQDSWYNFLAFMENLLFFLIRLFPFALVALVVFILAKPFIKKYDEYSKEKQKELAQKRRERAEEWNKRQERYKADKQPENKADKEKSNKETDEK